VDVGHWRLRAGVDARLELLFGEAGEFVNGPLMAELESASYLVQNGMAVSTARLLLAEAAGLAEGASE
jgi:hypothetical protein